jgi:MFS family permease
MNRKFFLLIQGQFVSKVGTQVALTATMFLLKQATGSATLVAALMAVCALPFIVLGPFGGTIADRYSRIGILIFCDCLSGVLLLSLSAITATGDRPLAVVITSIFVVNLLVAASNAFFVPAVNAAIPDILEERRVAQGMSWSQVAATVATFAGQGLGGVLLARGGASFLFFLDGASYLFTAGAESFIRLPPRKRAPAQPWRKTLSDFWSETREGIRYVQERPGMKRMFFAAVPLNVSLIPFFVLLPFYTTDLLHRDASWYGYLLAAFTLGTMAGFGIGLFGGMRRPGVQLSRGVVLNALLSIALGWVTNAWIALLLLFGLGFLVGVISMTAMNAFQTMTAAAMRGRVFGLLTTITQGLSPVAMCAAGIIADSTHDNVRLVYTACGAINLAVAIRICRDRVLRDFLENSVLPGTARVSAD